MRRTGGADLLTRASLRVRNGLLATLFVLQKDHAEHSPALSACALLLKTLQLLSFLWSLGLGGSALMVPLGVVSGATTIEWYFRFMSAPLYWVLLAAGFVWTVMFVMLTVYIGQQFEAGKVGALWTIRLLRSIGKASAGALFIPLFSLLLSPLSLCDNSTPHDGHHDEGGAIHFPGAALVQHASAPGWFESGLACGAGAHLGVILLFSLSAAVFLRLALVFTGIFIDAHPLSANLSAKACGRADVLIMVAEATLVAVTVLASENAWLRVAVNLCAAATWVGALAYYMPYHHASFADASMACAFVYAHAAVCLALQVGLGVEQFDAAMVFYLTFVLAAGCGVLFNRSRHQWIVSAPLSALRSPYEWEHRVHSLLQDATQKALSESMAGGAMSLLPTSEQRQQRTQQQQNASASGSFLELGALAAQSTGFEVDDGLLGGDKPAASSSKPIAASRDIPFAGLAHMGIDEREKVVQLALPREALEEAMSLYRLATVRFSGSAIIFAFWARSTAVFTGDTKSQLGRLVLANRVKPGLDVQFAAYAARRALEADSSGSMSILSRITYEKHLAEARRAVKATGAWQSRFFALLLDPAPCLSQLHAVAGKLAITSSAAEVAFLQIAAINPTSVPYLRLLSTFCFMGNNSDRAVSLAAEADRLEEAKDAEHGHASCNSASSTAFMPLLLTHASSEVVGDASARMEISGTSLSLGTILSATSAACRLFGFPNKGALEKRSINILVPTVIATTHEKTLRRFSASGEHSSFSDVTRVLMGKHTGGHVFPLYLCSRLNDVKDSAIDASYYTAVVRPVTTSENSFLIDNNLVIQEATLGSLLLLGWDAATLRGSEMQLSDLLVEPLTHSLQQLLVAESGHIVHFKLPGPTDSPATSEEASRSALNLLPAQQRTTAVRARLQIVHRGDMQFAALSWRTLSVASGQLRRSSLATASPAAAAAAPSPASDAWYLQPPQAADEGQARRGSVGLEERPSRVTFISPAVHAATAIEGVLGSDDGNVDGDNSDDDADAASSGASEGSGSRDMHRLGEGRGSREMHRARLDVLVHAPPPPVAAAAAAAVKRRDGSQMSNDDDEEQHQRQLSGGGGGGGDKSSKASSRTSAMIRKTTHNLRRVLSDAGSHNVVAYRGLRSLRNVALSIVAVAIGLAAAAAAIIDQGYEFSQKCMQLSESAHRASESAMLIARMTLQRGMYLQGFLTSTLADQARVTDFVAKEAGQLALHVDNLIETAADVGSSSSVSVRIGKAIDVFDFSDMLLVPRASISDEQAEQLSRDPLVFAVDGFDGLTAISTRRFSTLPVLVHRWAAISTAWSSLALADSGLTNPATRFLLANGASGSPAILVMADMIWDSASASLGNSESLRVLVLAICMVMGPGLCLTCALLVAAVLLHLQRSRDRIIMTFLDLPPQVVTHLKAIVDASLNRLKAEDDEDYDDDDLEHPQQFATELDDAGEPLEELDDDPETIDWANVYARVAIDEARAARKRASALAGSGHAGVATERHTHLHGQGPAPALKARGYWPFGAALSSAAPVPAAAAATSSASAGSPPAVVSDAALQPPSEAASSARRRAARPSTAALCWLSPFLLPLVCVLGFFLGLWQSSEATALRSQEFTMLTALSHQRIALTRQLFRSTADCVISVGHPVHVRELLMAHETQLLALIAVTSRLTGCVGAGASELLAGGRAPPPLPFVPTACELRGPGDLPQASLDTVRQLLFGDVCGLITEKDGGFPYNVTACRTFDGGRLSQGGAPALQEMIETARTIVNRRAEAVITNVTAAIGVRTFSAQSRLGNLTTSGDVNLSTLDPVTVPYSIRDEIQSADFKRLTALRDYLLPAFHGVAKVYGEHNMRSVEEYQLFLRVYVGAVLAVLVFAMFTLYLPAIKRIDRDIRHEQALLLLLPLPVLAATPSAGAMIAEVLRDHST